MAVTVIADSSPTPGGLAAIEGTLVVLLAALTALSAGEALAVTTVDRLTNYWFVVAVGGLAALRVVRRTYHRPWALTPKTRPVNGTS